MIVHESGSEAYFVWMEGETRCLTDPRSHEAFMTLDRADLRSVKAMNSNVLTRTKMKKNIGE